MKINIESVLASTGAILWVAGRARACCRRAREDVMQINKTILHRNEEYRTVTRFRKCYKPREVMR